MHRNFMARGLIPSALVLLLIAACTPPPSPDPPSPRSPEGATSALARGDISALRESLGQDEGFLDVAADGAARFDPEAWLVWVGAVRREHRLADAARALAGGDRTALAEALGFGEQQLHADILNAGSGVDVRRTRGRQFFEAAPQPIEMLRDAELPGAPPATAAVHVMLIGRRDGRAVRIEYGLRADGVTDLRARREVAMTQVYHPSDAVKLSGEIGGPWEMLRTAVPRDPHWYAAQLHCLLNDGRLLYLNLVRNEGAWFVSERSESSLAERLADARDKALSAARDRARIFERDRGHRAANWRELDGSGRLFVDPAAPSGRRGWAGFDDDPPKSIELSDDPEGQGWVVRSTHRYAQGFRAVTPDGRHIWVD